MFPDGNVAPVFAGLDFDDVAVLGLAGGVGDPGDLLGRADTQGGGVCCCEEDG